MAKCKGYKCSCGEVQFTIIDDFVTTDGTVRPVIICDSCGQAYSKPKDFRDENGAYE